MVGGPEHEIYLQVPNCLCLGLSFCKFKVLHLHLLQFILIWFSSHCSIFLSNVFVSVQTRLLPPSVICDFGCYPHDDNDDSNVDGNFDHYDVDMVVIGVKLYDD